MTNNELDLQGLDQIFRGNEESDREIEQKNVDFDIEIDYNTPIDVLKKNIYNANQLLEKIQHEMNNGNFSARLVEVTCGIINSITAASKEVISDENYEDYMEVKRALVKLKAKELEIKEMKNKGPNTQNNILVATREDILKLLKGGDIKQIENKKEEEQ